MIKLLHGFHHQVTIRITGMVVRSTTSGEWRWNPVYEELETYGLWKIKEYIQKRQVNIVAQVACRPIYELFMGAERMSGISRFMRWWDQDVEQEVE